MVLFLPEAGVHEVATEEIETSSVPQQKEDKVVPADAGLDLIALQVNSLVKVYDATGASRTLSDVQNLDILLRRQH